MASLLLVVLCVITGVLTSQAAPSKDTTVLNLIVQTTASAPNRISSNVPRYPPVADYNNLNYFRSQITVLNNGDMLAGAINKLYYIGQDFSTKAKLNWVATDTALCNFTYESSHFHCGNHIRIHKLQQDGETLLVCGTNAIKPKCRLYNLTNFSPIPGSTITPQPGLVPYRPDFKGLTINNDAFPGGVLAINYLGDVQVNFGISYQVVNINGSLINNTIQYRSIQGNVNWLKNPAAYVDYYADSYSTDDSLSFYFIFLTENSVEISGTDNAIIYSRVVRLCKNDPGVGELKGSRLEFRSDYFKTFVKAYIYCEKPMPSGTNSMPGSTAYQYNVIQKVSLVRNSTYRVGVSRRDRVVYGLFTGPAYGPPGSAICVFSADMSNNNDRGIFDVFNEEFRNLQPGQMSCTTQNVPNDDPFTCNVSTHNNSRPMPEFDILMSPAVSQLTTDPLVELNGITATAIYVAKTFVRNSTSAAGVLTEVDVILVGTNNGKILKIVMTYNGDDHFPLISEELSLADNLPIQNMEPQFVNDQFDHLLLSTDSYIYRIPPQRCDRFKTCVECVKARDPYCFWDQNIDPSQRRCKILQNLALYDPQMWYQDIHHGNVAQWNDCTGVVVNSSDSSETDSSDSSEAVIDFAIRSDVNNSTVNIYITPVENSAFNVTLSFKELHSCSNGVDSSLPGPEMLSVSGSTTRMYTTGFLPNTLYQVNVTARAYDLTRTDIFSINWAGGMSRAGNNSDTDISETDDINTDKAVGDAATVVSFTLGVVLVIAALVDVTHE